MILMACEFGVFMHSTGQTAGLYWQQIAHYVHSHCRATSPYAAETTENIVS